MEASAQMRWGVICSIQDPGQITEYIEFGNWLVKQLEESAAKLNLGHRFAEEATFALYAEPGSRDQSEKAYKMVTKDYPQASYVIHILPVPAKDSIEYEVLKEMTLQGSLIGQGVLAANAQNHFKAYNLDEVLEDMNQWIGRRLEQIKARRALVETYMQNATQRNAEAKKTVMGLGPIKELFQFPTQTQVPPAQNKPPYVQIKDPNVQNKESTQSKNNQPFGLGMTFVSSKYSMANQAGATRAGGGSTTGIAQGGGTSDIGRTFTSTYAKEGDTRMGMGSSNNNFILSGANSVQPSANVRKPLLGSSAGSGNYTGGFGRPQMQLPPPPLYGGRTDDFEHPVSIALHSYGNRSNYSSSSNQSNYRNPPPSPYTSSFGAPPPAVRPPSAAGSDHSSGNQGKKQQHPMEGTEREKEIIISGYPQNFNKFQIASLFSDFRPLNVQYIATGESIVQFANKYHAAQVIEKYNGRSYPDEGFCLKVQTAAQESPSKQIEHSKTKMSRLLLQMVTKEAAAADSSDNDVPKEQPCENEAKKPVEKAKDGLVKEKLAKSTEKISAGDTAKKTKRILSISADPNQNKPVKVEQKELPKSTKKISTGDTAKKTKRILSISADPNQNTKPVEVEQQVDEAVVAAAEQLP